MVSKLQKFVIKKIFWFVITVFVAITVNFFIMRLMPGDPVSFMTNRLDEMPGGQSVADAFRKEFGLDKPLTEQYYLYIVNLLHGNLGPSFAFYPQPVAEVIFRALPWTIALLGTTTILAWVIGNLMGVVVGWRRDSKLVSPLVIASICLNQIPYYVLALLFVFVFAYTLKIFPSGGGVSPNIFAPNLLNPRHIFDIIWHATLPALSIMIAAFGGWLLTMRSLIIGILGSDYLRFAELKGLPKAKILMKYAFRNALLPQVTGLAMSLGFIMSGALLTEIIFAYPGLGYTFFSALTSRDYNLMQGVLFLTLVAVLAGNTIIELIYPLIDPRIRMEET